MFLFYKHFFQNAVILIKIYCWKLSWLTVFFLTRYSITTRYGITAIHWKYVLCWRFSQTKIAVGIAEMNFQEVHLQLYDLTLSLVIKNVGNVSTDIGQQKTIRNTFCHQPILPQHGTTVFEGSGFIIDFHILVLLFSLSQMMLR